MTRETLLSSLRKFEDPSQTLKELEVDDQRTIVNDIDRTDMRFSKLHKSYFIFKLYLFILERTFRTFPIPYFQGMMEIAIVLVDGYFQDKAASFRLKYKDLDSTAPLFAKLESISEDERKIFEEFLKSNQKLYTRFRNSLVNVLDMKFTFFTKDNFKNYEKYNQVFIRMMKTHFKKNIESLSSIRYMNHTLTFFKRLSGNSDVAFKLFNLILNSEPPIVFSILAVFIDKAEMTGALVDEADRSKSLIMSLSENDLKKIIETHEMFLKCKMEVNKESGSGKMLLFFGAAAGCALVAVLLSKRSNDNKD